MENLLVFKVGTEWEEMEITSEPYVVFTRRGYTPAVNVAIKDGKEEHRLYISAKSLSEQVEELRKSNGGNFIGLKFKLKKEAEDKFSPYIVAAV